MREKLIELISATQYGNSLVGENFQEGFIAKIADNLIANGVTIPVRCKDCLGWCSEKIAKEYDVPRYCTLTRIPTDPDDFCCYGERRTE